jgi:hypothetical protein
MREAVLVDEFVDSSEDILMARDVIEGVWAVLLNPGLR